jgi:hypothetical protein
LGEEREEEQECQWDEEQEGEIAAQDFFLHEIRTQLEDKKKSSGAKAIAKISAIHRHVLTRELGEDVGCDRGDDEAHDGARYTRGGPHRAFGADLGVAKSCAEP